MHSFFASATWVRLNINYYSHIKKDQIHITIAILNVKKTCIWINIYGTLTLRIWYYQIPVPVFFILHFLPFCVGLEFALIKCSPPVTRWLTVGLVLLAMVWPVTSALWWSLLVTLLLISTTCHCTGLHYSTSSCKICTHKKKCVCVLAVLFVRGRNSLNKFWSCSYKIDSVFWTIK